MFWKARVGIPEEMYAFSRFTMSFLRKLGVFPYVVVREQSKLFLKFSPLHALYSYCLALLITSAVGYKQVYTNVFLGDGSSTRVWFRIDKIVFLFRVVGLALTVICGIFVTSNRVSQFFEYINCIKKVDSLIKARYFKTDKYKLLGILVFVSLYQIMIDEMDDYQAYSIVGQQIGLLGVLKRNFPYHVFHYLQVLVEYCNVYLAYSLKRRLVRLNMLLEVELKIMKEVVEGKSWNGMGKRRRNREIVTITKNATTGRILKLKRAYVSIMEAGGILNDLLGLNGLVGVMSLMIPLVIGPYYIIMVLQGKRPMIQLPSHMLMVCRQIIGMLLFIEPLYACTTELTTTKAFVCDLLSLNVDLNYRKEVRQFAVILGLGELSFTVCDFFDVNRSLYMSLINNINTYLMILIEAQESEMHE